MWVFRGVGVPLLTVHSDNGQLANWGHETGKQTCGPNPLYNPLELRCQCANERSWELIFFQAEILGKNMDG